MEVKSFGCTTKFPLSIKYQNELSPIRVLGIGIIVSKSYSKLLFMNAFCTSYFSFNILVTKHKPTNPNLIYLMKVEFNYLLPILYLYAHYLMADQSILNKFQDKIDKIWGSGLIFSY